MKTQKLDTLVERLHDVENQKASTDAELKQKTDSEAALKSQVDDLKRQLQAKLNAKKKVTVAVAAKPTIVAGCGDNSYASFIYMHESGCNTSAVNAGGCRGIGQACPGTKLPCGADYACQNAYFTNYAIARYGSWAAAYSFWISHRWW